MEVRWEELEGSVRLLGEGRRKRCRREEVQRSKTKIVKWQREGRGGCGKISTIFLYLPSYMFIENENIFT